MLKNAGAKYVILGHSENRAEGDTNQLIKKKIESALNQKLNIIFCIGETFKEKIKGKTFSVLKNQIKGSIDKKYNINKIIIAYEPIWSIGTGKIAKVQELKNTFKFIKNEFKKNFKTKTFPVVLYGGSVNDSNIGLFSSISEIDGFLIGGASKSSKKFIDIIKNYYK
jgi:triosephosphate isomerase